MKYLTLLQEYLGRYSAILAIAFVVVCAVAVLTMVRSWSRSRAAKRRIAALLARLEGGSSLAETEGLRSLEKAILRLERSIDTAAEEAVGQSADLRRMAESLERLDEAVIIADEACQIVYANAAARGYLDTVERSSEAHQLVQQRIYELLRETIEQEEDTSEEFDLAGPPRELLTLSAAVLDNGDRAIGAAVVVSDRTRLNKVDYVRRDFVANVSYELKTPVSALALLCDTLCESIDEPQVARKLAVRLRHASNRLSHTLEDLLLLARLEAEEAPKREPVSVDLVVAEAVSAVRAQSGGHAAIEAAVDPDAVIVGDRRQLKSAIYSLLENAVKFSEGGSPVSVTAMRIDSDVQISVTDEGIGIPANDLERIFERFYKVEHVRARGSGGSGLGLAIVRHVVSYYRGRIEVKSEIGLGSTFTISLPVDAHGESSLSKLASARAAMLSGSPVLGAGKGLPSGEVDVREALQTSAALSAPAHQPESAPAAMRELGQQVEPRTESAVPGGSAVAPGSQQSGQSSDALLATTPGPGSPDSSQSNDNEASQEWTDPLSRLTGRPSSTKRRGRQSQKDAPGRQGRPTSSDAAIQTPQASPQATPQATQEGLSAQVEAQQLSRSGEPFIRQGPGSPGIVWNPLDSDEFLPSGFSWGDESDTYR